MPADRRATALFADHFTGSPTFLASAPGRVNLIGDHTDYNDGFVLPMALEQATCIAGRSRADGRVICRSEEFEETVEFAIADLAVSPGPDGWGRYVEGVAWALAGDGAEITGWEGVVATDVPVGAGLSSSAALEIAAARACLAGDGWDPTRAALAGQKAENERVGVATGIMDQLTASAAVAGHALLIDCRSLAVEPVPLPGGTRVFVLDTTTRRQLTDSGYDDRRGECESGAAILGVVALRDATLDDLAAGADELGPLLEARCRHVVTENQRVLDTVEALRGGDPDRAGALMQESHRSLRDDFETSTPVMEALVRAANRAPGCFGARMTGGGFGGSAVALVDAAAAGRFVEAAGAGFLSATGLKCAVFSTAGGAGARLTDLH